MAGRNPKPDALKKAQGNPGRRKLATETSEAAVFADEKLPAIGAPPKTLSGEGRKLWNDIAPTLSEIRFIRRTDRAMLARYCDLLADFWKVTRKIRREGHTYWTESNHGKLKRLNPLFNAQMRLQRELTSLEDRIGLSPQARQNLLVKLSSSVQAPAGELFNNGTGEGETAPGAARFGDDAEGVSPVGILAAAGKLH